MAQLDQDKELDFLQEAIRRMLGHLESARRGEGSVQEGASPEQLRAVFGTFTARAPEAGLSAQEGLAFFEALLEHSVASTHPGFLNQLYGGLCAPGLAGDWLGAVVNMSMATFEISPAATALESLFFERVRALVGYPLGPSPSRQGGTLVPGGSNGNMVAMLAARNFLFPRTKDLGPAGLPAGAALCAFVSAEAHYSFEKAVNVLGLGSRHLWPVAVDSRGRMRPDALLEAVERARSEGLTPFFVGATAGTTVRAAFDPVDELAAVCEEQQLWLHVDAALGGSLLFSKKGRTWLGGLEKADSVVWDAHKLMNLPLVASMLVLRDPSGLAGALSGGGEDYLFHGRENAEWDTGLASLQCGRRADIFKVAMAWAIKGELALGEQMDAHLSRIARFGSRLAQDPRFELVYAPETVSLCFRVRGPLDSPLESPALDQLSLRERLLQEGRFMLNYANPAGDPAGKPFFRLVSLNNTSSDETFEELFSSLLRLAGHTTEVRLAP